MEELQKRIEVLEDRLKPIELTKMEKQIILYTKGHFKRHEYDQDLKLFAAKIYGLYPEQVEQRTIFHMMITIYQKLIDANYITFDLEEYLNRLFKNAWMRYNDKDKISFENILYDMIGRIQFTPVKGMELGEADLSIITNNN